MSKRLETEVAIAADDNAFEKGIMSMGESTPYTCPSCHGVLIKYKEGGLIRFRCHTGHAFCAIALLAGVTETVDDTLWQAMRALEEAAMLLDQIADHYRDGQPGTAELFLQKSYSIRDRARVVHDSVDQHESLSEDVRRPSDS